MTKTREFKTNFSYERIKNYGKTYLLYTIRKPKVKSMFDKNEIMSLKRSNVHYVIVTLSPKIR